MEIRTPADMRAVRDIVGLRIEDLANDCNIAVRTLRSWEKQGQDWFIPDDICVYLEKLLDNYNNGVNIALDQVSAIIETMEGAPSEIPLTYYQNQNQYDLYGRDKGNYRLVNAITRGVAEVLINDGYNVRFVYPEDRNKALDLTK
jgi:hypothetical protein